jgi:hypothetical protein
MNKYKDIINKAVISKTTVNIVIPACRESFRLVLAIKKDSGQARMTDIWNCGRDRRAQ